MPAKPRAAVALLLAASLLLGLAHIALLPPWEGFDETGHYSYIQQVATTGHWTRRGDKMSKDIDHYLKVAPANENVPRQWTYHQFFSADPEIIARGREIVHALPAAPRSFVPGVISIRSPGMCPFTRTSTIGPVVTNVRPDFMAANHASYDSVRSPVYV